jgi:predicted transcriptional regulator
MPALATPKAKRAAKNGPPKGSGSKATPQPSRSPRSAASQVVGVLQPKLRVNEPNDQYEREADHMADRVMSMPEPKPRGGKRDASKSEEPEKKLSLQRKSLEEEEQTKTSSLQRETKGNSAAERDKEAETAQTFALQREARKGKEEEELAQTASLQRPAKEQEEEKPQTSAVQRKALAAEPEKKEAVQKKEEATETSPLQRRTDEEPEQSRTSSLQRRAADVEDGRMQQRAKRPRPPRITPQFETGLRLLRRGGGQPLPETLRAFLEPRFGRSLADVRTHAGPEAAELARDANARAFTVGHHIVFGAGEYRPGVEQGRRLIAHELTHVFQQRGGLHSVQREVGPERVADDTSAAGLPSIEELRAVFDLSAKAAPPSVLSVAVEMLRLALLNNSDAARLKPFTTDASDAGVLVRRIESGAYTLELTALRGGGGVETSWKLTDRAKQLTFVSRSNSIPQESQGAAEVTDRATISLNVPPSAAAYPAETIVAGLESARRGVPVSAQKPAPLLPESVPAGSVPDKSPKVAAPVPGAETAAPAPSAESQAATNAPTPAAPPILKPPGEDVGATAQSPAVSGPSEPAAAESTAQESGEPAAAAVAEHAPLDPQEDPEFQQTLGQVKRTGKTESTHRPSKDKLTETGDASVIPIEQQRDRNDRDQHLKGIGAVAEKAKQVVFTPEDFKSLLADAIAAIKLPANEDEAKSFKEEKPLEAAKDNIHGKVNDQKKEMVGPLSTEVETTQPPPSNLPVQEPGKLEAEETGGVPRPISPGAAAPKPRLDSEVSMDRESASLDELMTENSLTEEQLAESNEPTFVEALNTKQEAQQQAAAAPGRFREQEQVVLAQAQAKAGHTGATKFGGMFKAREGVFGSVNTKQGATVRDDKAKQQEVLTELTRIYNCTKSDVDGMLTSLSTVVDTIFSMQVDLAKQIFESRVEDQLDDIYGVTVIDDWLFGEDTEAIEEVFRVEKARFLKTMDGVIDQIAVLIAGQLNAAIKRIEKGRTDAETFFKGLSTEQQRLSTEAFELFNTQYDILVDSVRDKQQELADTLAESYKSNLDSLRASFDKIKEDVSRGWIGKAIDFVKDVATVIKKLGELLWSVLSRIGNIVGDILAHPIRFIENLAEGIGAGFKQFIDKIDEYLVSGFFDWLRGSIGGAGITLPEKFDASGIFSLITQVLGLTYENFKAIAERVWGKPAVEMLEKGVAVAEKGLEFFQIVREQGLGGLWDYIKTTVANHVDELIDKVKETVLYATIEKALTFVAGLFTPVGAFIKAAQTIYAGVRFLIDNIDRIAQVVDAFLTSIELAVAGKTDAIAQRIVTALRGFIVLGIDFLAKLLGLGNLADKVRKILKAIQRPVEYAIEAVLKGLKSLVQGVFKRLGFGKKDEAKKAEQEAGRALTHEEVITEVVGKMEHPTEATTPAAALAEKKAQAESLVTKYQPMLEQGQLRIVINETATEVEEEAAVDFEVSASPGRRGQARVPLEVQDEKVVQERFAHARSLKKFTDDKGFVLDDWASTFSKLSRSTHQTDLRYGVQNKIIKKQEDTYHFKADVPQDEIAERGALELQNEGRNHPPFINSRFGVPLIQAFLSARKIAGIAPNTFDDTGVVADVATRAQKAGAINKVGKTSTWALPGIQPERKLPTGWGGVSHVRPRFYERGAGFTELANELAKDEIDTKIVNLIEEQLDNVDAAGGQFARADQTPWETMIAHEYAKPDEKFNVNAARNGFYYQRNRYDVDHVTPLAEDWNDEGGNNTDQKERIRATRGEKGQRGRPGGLALLEKSLNRSKGSGGITYHLWVGPEFTSTQEGADQYNAAEGEPFR